MKILKVVFGFNLKEAKAIVDSGSYVHIVDNLNNPIDAQQYFVDLLIRIDSACISTLAEQTWLMIKAALRNE